MVPQANPLLAGHIPAQDRDIRRMLDSARAAEAGVAFDEVIAAGPAFVDDQWNRATVLVHRATLAWRLGRISLALELAAEGWTELDSDHPTGAGAAHTTGMLGYLMQVIGHHRPARELLRLSVQLARESGDQETLAHCLGREANAELTRAVGYEPEVAYKHFANANELYAEALSQPTSGLVSRASLAGRARALAGIGEFERALPLAERALELCVEAEDVFSGSIANWSLSAISRGLDDLEGARTYASRALEAAETTGDALTQMRFSLDLAEICSELCDPVGEAAALRRTVGVCQSGMQTLQEGLGQALEQRRVAVQAQRLAMAAQKAAIRDPLTGLINRLGLERHAPRLLQQTAAQGHVPWLVMIDIDWFKDVNDDAGHTTGDAVLQEIAQLLQQEFRAGDLLCRWGGDEFVVLLLDTSEASQDAGPLVAERIRAAVAAHDWRLLLGAMTKPPTLSIGVAAGPANFEHLFAAADIALYRAKQGGRNRVEVDRTGPANDQPTITRPD